MFPPPRLTGSEPPRGSLPAAGRSTRSGLLGVDASKRRRQPAGACKRRERSLPAAPSTLGRKPAPTDEKTPEGRTFYPGASAACVGATRKKLFCFG